MRDNTRSAIEYCRARLSCKAIAERLGCSAMAVSKHARGLQEPADGLGQAYRALARELGWEETKQNA